MQPLQLSFLATALLCIVSVTVTQGQGHHHRSLQAQTKDWDRFSLNMSGIVTLTLKVPQFRRQRRQLVKIGLFEAYAPHSVANFAQLAYGGVLDEDKVVRSYKDTPIHSIAVHHSISTGDVVHGNGTGTVSISGGAFLPLKYEYQLSNYGKGWVGMVPNYYQNNSIGCQFYICMTNDRAKLADLNAKATVVIGKVIEGFKLLENIDNAVHRGRIQLDDSLRPTDEIIITDSQYQPFTDSWPPKWKRTTTNQPAAGHLHGSWPTPPQPHAQDNSQDNSQDTG